MRADAVGRLNVEPQQAARLIVAFTSGLVVIERAYQDEKCLRTASDLLVNLLLKAD